MVTRFGAFLAHDTDGNVAQLHSLGVQRFGDRWYAYGENKVKGNRFQGVMCYSTTDFDTWQSHGIVLDVQPDGALSADMIGERPKVLHCPSTGKYVMIIHAESPDYQYAHLGFAIGDSPVGPFEFRYTLQWKGYISRDIGVFQDKDGSGYVMSEDRAHGCHIYKLADDYLSIVEDVACERATDYRFGVEAPTIVRKGDTYYWFGSLLTGWFTNDNVYATASDLHGPWSEWKLFAPKGSHTWDSQTDIVIPLDEDEYNSEHFLFIGDRWNKDDLGNSYMVQLPIEIANGEAKLEWKPEYEGETHRSDFGGDASEEPDPGQYL
ncbi:family 43 glycosylhydrolase [Bifidobacterium oedipodis]|uniref:Glycosyl hydrolase family 43 n=1 Tax=Bifidobacterium oedipodis TaxID=2675322 RepID=A0A7Y0EQ92_9BIFI|nr:family 43 glycosylhydrolase [Bifidobacterium sp. DSM 109957]NMM94422.1 glycosyl hydrolase family 43 [Bifidobacterium sp. DSM 109957]